MAGKLPSTSNEPEFPRGVDLLTVTIQQLQDHLRTGSFTSVQLVREYLRRIEKDNRKGLSLGAVLEVSPLDKLIPIATNWDAMRQAGIELSAMHGIPILVKDSIATDPELGMQTTAGSHALAGSIVPGDAAVVKNLRSAGAIILGKANLSELSGIRGDEIQGEWSGRGGYCYSAYVENGDPEGSSSGSAVSVSAGFAAGSLGGDTTESITWPAGKAACYSLRPTLGLVPTAGCIPLAAKQDVIGPLGKSAHDVALMLSHMACDTSNVTMFKDYTIFTDPAKASFKGKRLGVPRADTFADLGAWEKWGYKEKDVIAIHQAFDKAVAKMRDLGGHVQDPADLPCGKVDVFNEGRQIIQHEFRELFGTYLSTVKNCQVKDLKDLVEFNDDHPDLEMPNGPTQQLRLRQALQAEGTGSKSYKDAITEAKRIHDNGIGALFKTSQLDAVVVPSDHVDLVRHGALGGLPVATVPLGLLENDTPFGLSFIGRRGSEATLCTLMAAFEYNFPPRAIPKRLQG